MNNNKPDNETWEFLKKISLVTSLVVGPLYFLLNKVLGISQEDPVVIFGVSSLVSLVILTMLLWNFRGYSKTRTDNRPFYGKKWFIYAYSFSSIALVGFTVFETGARYGPSVKCQSNKTRIVLMLPLSDIIKPAYQDGMRQMYGYAEFLNDYNSRYTDDFEFCPIDHSMKYEIAKQILEKEVNNGTKFFISTMSKVNEELTKNFEDIISHCKYTGEKPILICTVTSSPSIVVKPNSTYRFYVRSQEEAKCLADIGNQMGISSATFIVVKDEYGKGAIEEFKKCWKGRVTEGIRVELGSSVAEIEQMISRHISRIPPNERQAIFVAHYGNGIDNIIRGLDNARIDGMILATSTLSIPDWQTPIRDILRRHRWYTCVPGYKSADKNQDDVIKNFTTHTLKRLIQAINLKKGNPQFSFDDSWKRSEVSLDLDISWETNGDAIIPVKAADRRYFE